MFSGLKYCRIATVLALAIGAEATSLQVNSPTCKNLAFTTFQVACGTEGVNNGNTCKLGDEITVSGVAVVNSAFQGLSSATTITPKVCLYNAPAWWNLWTSSYAPCYELQSSTVDSVCSFLGLEANSGCPNPGTYSFSVSQTIPADVGVGIDIDTILREGSTYGVTVIITSGDATLDECTVDLLGTSDAAVATTAALLGVAALLMAGAGYYTKKRRSAAAITTLDSTHFIQMTDRNNAAVV